jgi:hypothetical protein
MGPDGEMAYAVFEVRAAYNSIADEFLIVWAGEDNTAPLVEGERELFGQRVDAATGAEIGATDFRISDMGNEGESSPDIRDDFGIVEQQVVYNPTENEYLVVWVGQDDRAPLVSGETEVFGQRIDGETGLPVGPNDFRISAAGGSGANGFNVQNVSVAYCGSTNEYLVVWSADDNRPPLVDGEFEIFGQRLSGATGAEVGVDDFRISDMGDDLESSNTVRARYDAVAPRVACNETNGEFLVVWQSDDDRGALAAYPCRHRGGNWGERLSHQRFGFHGRRQRLPGLGARRGLGFRE